MIDYEFSQLFGESGYRHLVLSNDNVIIDNQDISQESMKITEGITGDELKFGTCISSEFIIKVRNNSESLVNQLLNVSMAFEGHEDAPFNYGEYRVISDTPTTERNFKTIKAYDRMYDIIHGEVSQWYNSYSFPSSLKAFRDSFLAYLGIEQEQTSLVNDNLTVEKTILADSISGEMVMRSICEINGVFPHINRQGVLVYITLPKNYNDATEITNYYQGKCAYEDYIAQPISQLQIRQMSGDVGVTVGGDGNKYIVDNNFLCYGKNTSELTTIANNLLSVIEGVSFRPCSISLAGNPCYEVGDAIKVKAPALDIDTFIFNRVLSGIYSLKDNFTAKGKEIYVDDTNSLDLSVKQVRQATNVLTRTIEETKSEVKSIQTDLDENYPTYTETETLIKQSTEGIAAEVTKVVSANLDVGGTNFLNSSLYLQGLIVGGIIYLKDENYNILKDENGNGLYFTQ